MVEIQNPKSENHVPTVSDVVDLSIKKIDDDYTSKF